MNVGKACLCILNVHVFFVGCTVPRPVRYADLGGIEAVLSDIKELVEYPLRHPEVCLPLGHLCLVAFPQS